MTATNQDVSLPEGFTVRAPRLEDAERVAALINARSIADTGSPALSVSDILLYWNEPGRDLSDEDWLVVAPDDRLAAFLELYESEPYTVFEFDSYVHPDYAGLGIESALLAIIEPRARRELHRAPEGERVVLHTFSPSQATATHQILEAHGYVHIRDGLTMLIEFDSAPETSLPVGVTIRPAVIGQDERAVWETAEAAWEDHWGYAPMPFDEFRYYRIEAQSDFDPTLWHLAEVDGSLAGVALCLPERAGFDGAGWISLLGVRREFRGRGIGLALLRHVFADFYRRGFHRVGLGVDASSLTGADRLYRRAGMQEVKREFTFEKVLREAS
jgi:GNAT superfamily N-acetyltransferase